MINTNNNLMNDKMIDIDNGFTIDYFKKILEKDNDFTTRLLKIRHIDEEQKEWMIFIGQKAAVPYRFESESDAQFFIEKKPYSIIFSLIAAMIDANNNITKESTGGDNK